MSGNLGPCKPESNRRPLASSPRLHRWLRVARQTTAAQPLGTATVRGSLGTGVVRGSGSINKRETD